VAEVLKIYLTLNHVHFSGQK